MPSDHRDWNALAWTYLQSGQSDLALDAAQRAHEANRSNLEYLNTLGVAYGEAGDLERAEASFRKALKKKPVFVDALINLAKTLEKQERFGEAVPLYERALALDASFPKLAPNLANLYRQRGDAGRARQLLERLAAHIDPQDLAMALAACDQELAGIAAAIERLSGAVAQHPEWLIARHALAHACLADGRWGDGWRHYLARHGALAAAELPPRLDDQRILLRGEQGIGDVLFFLRFAPLLKARGARLGLVCARKLHGLLGASFEAVMETEAPGFDRTLWLGDLPVHLACEATPPAWPLKVSDDARRRARERLAALGPGPYLAATWRAGTDTARGREFGPERASLAKALPPGELGQALRGWKGAVILLQRVARADEAHRFANALGAPCHDLSALGDDLPMLLAVLAEIDEYVTVSNANVHLLAGLGRTARALIPYPAEWRWMRRDGRSPWFPDFPVYRQSQSRDWQPALLALRRDLGL